MRVIEIDQTITVSNLAQELELPATSLISELVKNGLMLTLNEKIDFETVAILVDELGLDVTVKPKKEIISLTSLQRSGVINKTRPPVVAMMGHVDHGKTSLIDKITHTKTVESEAGNITQHISAQQIEHQNRHITFLDTPGHEAFAAIREHGAILTDLVILVVAADDGVKQQTLEALRFAKKAGVKIIIAASKIDKPGANLPRLKQQLAENDLLPEDLGGQTIVVPVSAKTGEGIKALLDMILLVADLEELEADSRGFASGLVIESYMKKGLGAVAVVLIQQGILNEGSFFYAGPTWGKVRLMRDTQGYSITTAGPSTPVLLSGFKELPEFGAHFEVVDGEKEAKKQALIINHQQAFKTSGMSSGELLRIMKRRTQINEYKVIIKADVKGSLTSVIDNLKSLDTDEVATKVIHHSVGALTENDINIAQITEATIYCFNLPISPVIRRHATQLGVVIKTYTVIYELLEDVKRALEKLLAPQVTVTKLGVVQIKGIFKTSKTELICGGELQQGKISLPAFVKIMRDEQELAQAQLVSIARGSKEIKEAVEGSLYGFRLQTEKKINLKLEDKLEFYRTQITERKLE